MPPPPDPPHPRWGFPQPLRGGSHPPNTPFCPPTPPGDILEIGAQWSILKKDIPSFERYMAQLKCYYFDYK